MIRTAPSPQTAPRKKKDGRKHFFYEVRFDRFDNFFDSIDSIPARRCGPPCGSFAKASEKKKNFRDRRMTIFCPKAVAKGRCFSLNNVFFVSPPLAGSWFGSNRPRALVIFCFRVTVPRVLVKCPNCFGCPKIC